MIKVRTEKGRVLDLNLHHPLRLRLRPEPNASTLSSDIIRRIFSFLAPLSEDWLAADSCCSPWREAAWILWKGRRSDVKSSIAASRRIGIKWKKLEGFLDREVLFALCDPAKDDDLRKLKETARPWVIPPGFVASLKVHDGERDRGPSRGMYFGSRLLSTREISQTCQTWKKTRPLDQTQVLRLPVFSLSGTRQVAIELCLDCKDERDGRVILISSSLPYAAHFKVLACNWENFLTLV
mmetsp:Transcript_19436/g.29214  ORF Transcript_19436/g.29214 Transcript_19436/m.29214 type:complete len:238 (-) Transcript_19436:41-754(-)